MTLYIVIGLEFYSHLPYPLARKLSNTYAIKNKQSLRNVSDIFDNLFWKYKSSIEYIYIYDFTLTRTLYYWFTMASFSVNWKEWSNERFYEVAGFRQQYRRKLRLHL